MNASSAETTHRIACLVLVTFLFTFATSRIVVYLIMSGRIPDLYAHVAGTHIHHLNYGIFLLVGVGAYLLFTRPTPRGQYLAAGAYGVGLGLTFDEFGMWLHLNDLYWQRASFDAIIVITAVLALIVLAPRWRLVRPHHWATGAALVLVLAMFTLLLGDSLRYADTRLVPRLQQLDRRGPR